MSERFNGNHAHLFPAKDEEFLEIVVLCGGANDIQIK